MTLSPFVVHGMNVTLYIIGISFVVFSVAVAVGCFYLYFHKSPSEKPKARKPKKELKVNIYSLAMGFVGIAGFALWQWFQQFIWYSGCVCNYWIGGGCIDPFGHLTLLAPYILSFSAIIAGFRTAFYRE